MLGLPPDASCLLSKIKLKSPPKLMILLLKSFFFQAVSVEQKGYISDSALNWSYKN